MSIKADREFWLSVRQAQLALVDAIERELAIKPSTAEIRRAYRSGNLLHAEEVSSAILLNKPKNIEET